MAEASCPGGEASEDDSDEAYPSGSKLPRLACARRNTPTRGRSYATLRTTYKDYRSTSEREYKKKLTKGSNQVRPLLCTQPQIFFNIVDKV